MKINRVGLMVLVAMAAAYAVLSNQDYEHAKLAEREYCEMTRGGHWGNYKGIDCG